MEILMVVVTGAVVLAAVTAAIWLLLKNQLPQVVLKLVEKNEEHRQSSKTELESGMKGMLDGHRELMDRIASDLKDQLIRSQTEAKELRGQNAAIREQLSNTVAVTQTLRDSTEGLKNLLTNNRLRGEWGEQVAEDLLLSAGFVEKLNYTKQTNTQDGRPDFTILLPEGAKLNIDAKFPFDDLIAYQEAKSEAAKKQSLQRFQAAIKEKIKHITSKDYIDPEAGTLDFVVMFIPNEMIFSFIYEKLPAINQYANERKVIMAGPFGFTAVIRMIQQAYKHFNHEKGLRQILGLIGKFQQEYAKFGDSMQKLGRQLETTRNTYIEVEGTRSRSLTRVVEKIEEQAVNGNVLGEEPLEELGRGERAMQPSDTADEKEFVEV